jgi:murein DD-endopeptidase MepM/ murein hydrolase activator NlpD
MLGQNADKAPGGWYCDPGPAAGAALSKLLLTSVSGVTDPTGSSAAAAGPTSSFPCEDIGAGRAKVAASLVELPAGVLKRPDQVISAAEALSSGMQRYFSENGASVRSARGSARLVWPAAGPISSYFGPSHPLGIDIAESTGNIVAATDGTVAFSGGNSCCSYGLYVVIDSPTGVRTVYGHLSTLGVAKGQKVAQGQALGKVGCTGHCTGPHLHFEVIERGVRYDPLKYLP